MTTSSLSSLGGDIDSSVPKARPDSRPIGLTCDGVHDDTTFIEPKSGVSRQLKGSSNSARCRGSKYASPTLTVGRSSSTGNSAER